MSDVVRIVDRDGVVSASTGKMPVPPGALQPVPLPADLPGGGVSIREAVLGDIPFIDDLLKANNKALGFMPTAQLEGHLEQGHILIAETMGVNSEQSTVNRAAETASEQSIVNSEQATALRGSSVDCSLGTDHSPPEPVPVGYCIGGDKYFKREDTGIIYQMNICPERRRGLVAASLLKAMFERSAYGVKLFCCWCAQDLEANGFWEAMGFVPLAFRTGSRKKSWKGADGVRRTGPRIHIFWQKRIRCGDDETPWWFPSQTGSGAIREDRIVLPIPPGTHWRDAKPAVLPGVANIFGEVAAEREAAVKALEGAPLSPEQEAARKAERKAARERAKAARQAAAERSSSVASGGLRFGSAAPEVAASASNSDTAKQERKEAEKAARKKVAKKNDPRLVAMARELRDRWQEHVAAQPGMLEGRRCGKYDVSRRIGGGGLGDVGVPEAAGVPGVPGVQIVEMVEARRLGEREGREAA